VTGSQPVNNETPRPYGDMTLIVTRNLSGTSEADVHKL
jgi:hypothetical protein